MAHHYRIGLDFGGTKIAGVLLAPDGAVLAESRHSTPKGDYPGSLDAVAALAAELKQMAGVASASIGIGIPGSISPKTGLIRNANSTWLNGKAFRDDLCDRLRQDIRLENDANCMTLSEAVDGAGAGHSCVFGVILGTGVGGGIVINQRILLGRNLIAGEWGHSPMPQPDGLEDDDPPVCYCGRRGCIETYLSGPGLALDHRRRTGQDVTGPAIIAAAEANDPGAQTTLDRYCTRLGKALAVAINLLDPDAVVLGGGLSRIDAIYRQIDDALSPHMFSDVWDTPVLPAMHGDASGVRGAAWLWPRDDGNGA